MPAPAQTSYDAGYGRSAPLAWAAFAREWDGISAYSTTLTVSEEKDSQTQHMVLDYNFRKPSNALVHFIQGPNAGVTLSWTGGTTMEAHRGSGLVALFKKTFSLHDSQATTIRGSSIDQMSFGAILDHAQQTQGTISQSDGPVIDGVETDALTLVPANPATDTGLTLEVIDISKTTHLPMRVLGYEGAVIARSIEFGNVKLEP